MATEVIGVRDDDGQRFVVEVDGIWSVYVPYIVADKFKGLAAAVLKAAQLWAIERDKGNIPD